MKTRAKGLKKAFAIIMALAVVLSYSMVPTFADNSGNSIEITKLEENAENLVTVTAYKIVEQDQNSSTGWKSNYVADPAKPKIDEVIAIAQGKKGTLPTGIDIPVSGTTAKKTGMEPGMYLVLVTPKAETGGNVKVYNPMIVSVDFETPEGTIAADGTFVKQDAADPGQAYVKSEAPNLDKNIKPKTTNGAVDNDSTTKGDTANGGKASDNKVGDTVSFEITTPVPYYGAYENAKFVVSDVLSKGLKLNKDSIKVYINDDELAEGKYDIPADDLKDSGFKVSLKSSYLTDKTEPLVKNLKITYSAVIQSDCLVNFQAETNTASLEYTNAPGEEQEADPVTTYHYTFSINTDIEGEINRATNELYKIGLNEDGTEQLAATKTNETKEKVDFKARDATFALYAASDIEYSGNTPVLKANAQPIRTGATDDNGRIVGFTRLDAGTYYMVEQTVKDPFKVISTPVRVDIKATLNAQSGQLESYSIGFGADKDGANATATMSYNKKADGTIETVQGSDSADVMNYKTGTLPSTGGMGTVLFTIAGIALMAIAAGLFMASRRRNAEEE